MRQAGRWPHSDSSPATAVSLLLLTRAGSCAPCFLSVPAKRARRAQTLRELDARLRRIGELRERARELHTRHEVTARGNSEQRVRLVALYGEEDVDMSAEALVEVQTGIGAADEDQAELRQLTRERDASTLFPY